MSNDKKTTGHKQVPGDTDQAALGNADGSMPMGMTGSNPGEGDPDQKSTHNAPKTFESTLPDGSPKYVDGARERRAKRRTSAGRFEVLSPIRIAIGERDEETKRYPSRTCEIGEIVELSELDAESLGENIRPAR